LLFDGVDAPNETITSDWIVAAPAVFGIQFGELPINFSRYETF